MRIKAKIKDTRKDYLISFRERNALYERAFDMTDLLIKIAQYNGDDTAEMYKIICKYKDRPIYERIECYNVYAETQSEIVEILEISKCIYQEELMGK